MDKATNDGVRIGMKVGSPPEIHIPARPRLRNEIWAFQEVVKKIGVADWLVFQILPKLVA
jgi:hypothetical protein